MSQMSEKSVGGGGVGRESSYRSQTSHGGARLSVSELRADVRAATTRLPLLPIPRRLKEKLRYHEENRPKTSALFASSNSSRSRGGGGGGRSQSQSQRYRHDEEGMAVFPFTHTHIRSSVHSFTHTHIRSSVQSHTHTHTRLHSRLKKKGA